MAFSKLLKTVGDSGRFQLINSIILCIPLLIIPAHHLIQNFSAATPRHHCRVPWIENATLEATRDTPWNLSKEDLLRVAIPWEHDSLSRCSRFVRPQWQLLLNDSADDVEIEGCLDGWEFDSSDFRSTIVTEWNLVCDKQAMKRMAQSVYMGGVLVGGFLLGGLADKIGRRSVMVTSNFLVGVSGITAAFAPTFALYTVARFFDGMFIVGSFLNAFSLGLEWLHPNHYVIFNMMTGQTYSAGQFLLAGLAYSMGNWRYLQLTASMTFFLFFLISWFTPESARWLAQQHRYEDTLRSFKRVARINGKRVEAESLGIETVKREMENDTRVKPQKTYTSFDLIRISVLRKRTLILFIVWFATSFSYYGVAMNLQGFNINIYVLMLMFAAIDIPFKLLTFYTITSIGRRVSQAACLLLVGVIFIVIIFLPSEMKIVRASLGIIGKGALAGSFNIVFLYTGELYPTVIRQNGLGTTATMARVGGMLAPLISIFQEEYPFLPQIVYGVASLLAGLLALLLPETRNRPLLDTVEEMKFQQQCYKQGLEDLTTCKKEPELQEVTFDASNNTMQSPSIEVSQHL
uniref:solute carrier family 22 member 6-B-like isoform X1 n=1 Tax=Myxine glutinosa TaxID=7769 RepID=UPI00358E88F6